MELLLAVKQFLEDSGYRGQNPWGNSPKLKSVYAELQGQHDHQLGTLTFHKLAEAYDAEIARLDALVYGACEERNTNLEET